MTASCLVLVLLSTSVSTLDLVTLKFQGNKHPPLATSPQPAGPPASSAHSSSGQKPCTALYCISFVRETFHNFHYCLGKSKRKRHRAVAVTLDFNPTILGNNSKFRQEYSESVQAQYKNNLLFARGHP